MKRTALTGLVVLVALALLPLALDDVFYQRVAALVLLGAISASAWNLIGGYAGQVSVGHAVFFGAGAYAALLVYASYGAGRRWPVHRSASRSAWCWPR